MQRALVALIFAVLPTQALARAGTWGATVANWDTRASSRALSWHQGMWRGGHLWYAGYHSAFTSTSGRGSSQFGLAYVQSEDDERPEAKGVAASAIGVYNLPVERRYRNGLPRQALAIYGGLAPVAIVGLEATDMSFPAVLGVGFSIAPVKWLTITPYAEGGVGYELDTRVEAVSVELDVDADPGELSDGQITITQEQMAEFVGQAIQRESGWSVSGRAGVAVTVHAGDTANVALRATAARLDSGDDAHWMGFGGVTVAWLWDDVVSAVKPRKKKKKPRSKPKSSR